MQYICNVVKIKQNNAIKIFKILRIINCIEESIKKIISNLLDMIQKVISF